MSLPMLPSVICFVKGYFEGKATSHRAARLRLALPIFWREPMPATLGLLKYSSWAQNNQAENN